MQLPLLFAAQAVEASRVSLWIGLGLIGLLAAQVVLLFCRSLLRLGFEREQRRLSRERLQWAIRVAAAQGRRAEECQWLWNGLRKFTVARKVAETDDVCSLYLAPHDGKPLPPFKPGQYLTFQLHIPGQAKPVIRCYSLSDSPNHSDYYRVTIKRCLPPGDQPNLPPGVASRFFCEQVREGDILDVKAPSGNFALDLTLERPVVLIAGGVGVTPVLSMLNAIVEGGSPREVWFFFGVRHGGEHIQKPHLARIAATHENVHLHVCYSQPRPQDRLGTDYHHTGYVSVDLFKELLPSNNYEYFICGPGPMMKSVTDGLKAWGVPEAHVLFEAFGPATVKKVAPPVPEAVATGKLEVTFSRSSKTCVWSGDQASLLEFAEANGVKIDSGCRAGNCGTCLVALKSGEVDYLSGHGAPTEERSCLTCVCRPRTSLVLDA